MAEAAQALAFPELVLGRYRPLKPLGSGGSGSVWLARDEQTQLDVALKIVAREGKAAARAEREAEAAARLRHPACLRTYGLSHDSRHVYIAYEYIPGQTFREALRARELDDEAAIEACAQVCEGIAHAHAAGILHRDVKPSNVLLADGPHVSARVLDFGLALMEEAETLTEQGDVPGTLAYISPERLAGKPATAAADVWAVGVMLWEALAGRHPFWRGSMLETARAIESGARPLGDLRPELPKRLLRLVDRALAQDPGKRPSARELAAELRGLAPADKKEPSRATVALPSASVRDRAVTAVLAAALAGWTAAAIPFFPPGWPLALGGAVVAATLARERLGIALALAVPIFPIGNFSSGAALLYVALAAALLVVMWREPQTTLLFALGPLLAPLALIGLLPLATWRIGSGARRALVTALGVLTAAVVAGVGHGALPLVGGAAPRGAGLRGAPGALGVAGTLADTAAGHPALLLETALLAAVAVALPYVAGRGLRWSIGLGAGMLAATILVLPAGAPFSLAAPLAACSIAVGAFSALRAAQ
ncbi:MAG TPA: serine/threonine-protein kinase [Gaiellaceae bacterium]|nr:serine/threonine-protein kinase [Gaiellaceae bacterium]